MCALEISMSSNQDGVSQVTLAINPAQACLILTSDETQNTGETEMQFWVRFVSVSVTLTDYRTTAFSNRVTYTPVGLFGPSCFPGWVFLSQSHSACC